jgi:hypothetical protein
MNETVATVAVLLVVAVAAFAVAIRLGMLLGMRLDRAMEARAAAGDGESGSEQPGPPGAGIRKEDRGE